MSEINECNEQSEEKIDGKQEQRCKDNNRPEKIAPNNETCFLLPIVIISDSLESTDSFFIRHMPMRYPPLHQQLQNKHDK